MLESFRLCCQWFMTSKGIIEEAKESSNILWTRLVSLLNLTTKDNPKYEKDAELQKVDIQVNFVFPEEKISRGMTIFEEFHKSLDFDTSTVQLTKNQMVGITLVKVNSLNGMYISHSKSCEITSSCCSSLSIIKFECSS